MKQVFVYAFILFIFPNFLQAQENLDSLSNQNNYIPGDHELFFMPTAYTMEQGRAYFSDYELFFLNFTYAPTSSTHIGAFILFPITSSFGESFSIGAKQNYYKSQYFQGALWGSFTLEDGFYTFGNVFSIGEKSKSIHIGAALAGETETNDNSFILLIGGRLDFSDMVTGIVEYTTAAELLDQDFKGILSFGIRFRTESTAWELAAVRPLASTGDLLFLPFLKGTIYF